MLKPVFFVTSVTKGLLMSQRDKPYSDELNYLRLQCLDLHKIMHYRIHTICKSMPFSRAGI